MKNLLYLLILLPLFFGCDDKGQRFSGSPTDNGNFVNLDVTISTPETVVSSGQSFPFTVTIAKAFEYDVIIQAIVTSKIQSVRRAFVTLPAGSTSVTGNIIAPSAVESGEATSITSTFTQSCVLKAVALTSSSGSDKNYYNIISNVITLNHGDTGVPIPNPERCIVLFDCKGPWGESGNPLENSLDLIVKKDGVIFTAAIPPSSVVQNTKKINERYERFSILEFYPPGVYSFEPYFPILISNGSLNCRIVVVFPDGTIKTIDYTANNLVAPTAPVEKLKIKKWPTGTVPLYTIL